MSSHQFKVGDRVLYNGKPAKVEELVPDLPGLYDAGGYVLQVEGAVYRTKTRAKSVRPIEAGHTPAFDEGADRPNTPQHRRGK